MNNIGIKTRVIFLGTIPALLFAIILVGYAITNIFGVLDQSVQTRGKIIASQLTPAAEYGVIPGNNPLLQKLVQQAFSNEQDLTTVTVVGSQGQTLALRGRELPKALIAKISKERLAQVPQDKGVIYTSFIYRSLVEFDDISAICNLRLKI